MKFYRLMATALALALAAGGAQAQYAYPPPDQPPPQGYAPQGYAPPPPQGYAPQGYPQQGYAPPPQQGYAPPPPGPPLYAPPALDQMLAPIALYPDPLLSELLAAATYPGEVEQAAQWRAQNPGLAGPALAATVQGYDWDPSVKSLTAFPQILAMLAQHLDWTQALGNAFMAQQAAVMESIQRLRHEAYAAGALAPSPYESVMVAGNYIEIEPASPQAVYVPVYDPARVYGAWAYPAYPPVYWGPPPGLEPRFALGAIGFAAGIGVADVLWHWGDWDWQRHDMRIDPDRFNRLNAGHPPIAGGAWHHDGMRAADFTRGGPPARAGGPRGPQQQQANVAPQQRRARQAQGHAAQAPQHGTRPAWQQAARPPQHGGQAQAHHGKPQRAAQAQAHQGGPQHGGQAQAHQGGPQHAAPPRRPPAKPQQAAHDQPPDERHD